MRRKVYFWALQQEICPCAGCDMVVIVEQVVGGAGIFLLVQVGLVMTCGSFVIVILLVKVV